MIAPDEELATLSLGVDAALGKLLKLSNTRSNSYARKLPALIITVLILIRCDGSVSAEKRANNKDFTIL